MRWTCLAAMAAVVAAALILAPGVQAADPIWAYTHPEAKVLIGVDWQRAKSSPTAEMIRKQLIGLGGPGMDMAKGFDFIESVDRILLSAPGELGGTASESPMLLVLQGKVDHAALRKSLIPGTAVERYKGLDLLIAPPGKDGQDLIAALVSDSITLLGDRASIELALEDGHGLRDEALLARAEKMAASSEIWMIAATPPMKTPAGGEPNPLASSFDELQSMDFGISLAQGLGLKMNMEFSDAASAQSLAMGAQMLTSMMMSSDKNTPEMAQIARSLNIEQTGSTLQVNVDIPLELLQKGVIQARSGIEESGPRTLEGLLGIGPKPGAIAGVRPTVSGAIEPVQPAWPREPETRTIRIVGLDDGVREINYSVGGKRP